MNKRQRKKARKRLDAMLSEILAKYTVSVNASAEAWMSMFRFVRK